MQEVYIVSAVRTPIGRYGGVLSNVRTDDLGALPISALMNRNPAVDWSQLDDLVYGCAKQAGEDNRNVARMSGLLSGLPITIAGTTVNRLCGSGMDAIGIAARSIKCGENSLVIAGGVESMSRAPFVMPKATTAFSRSNAVFDTTMGWRFVNHLMESQFGIDSMPETAENVAEDFGISREDQDVYAFRSQQRTSLAQRSGVFDEEIIDVHVPQPRKETLIVTKDEHPRGDTSLDQLAKLGTPFRKNGTVTAGNASGINDGACALLLGNAEAGQAFNLSPIARVVAMATVGVEPRIMGMGPGPATEKVLALSKLTLNQMDVIELNEAFAAQALGVMRYLKLEDDAPHVNPNGGAISLGHPLGMSGARLVTTAARQLKRQGGRYGLCTMCIGVGQGIAMIIENPDAEG